MSIAAKVYKIKVKQIGNIGAWNGALILYTLAAIDMDQVQKRFTKVTKE